VWEGGGVINLRVLQKARKEERAILNPWTREAGTFEQVLLFTPENGGKFSCRNVVTPLERHDEF
jgi:hypothetical protein